MATILVVDDRPINREFLATLLGYARHRVHQAADGAEALLALEAETPDLVISDILMPVMDGVELARRVAGDPRFRDVPVIFYTATHRLSEARVIAATCGVTTVIPKPSEPQALLDAIHEQLGLPPLALEGSADPPGHTAPGHSSHGGYFDEIDNLRQELAASLAAQPAAAGLDQLVANFDRSFAQAQGLSMRLAALIELGLDLPKQADSGRMLEMFCHAARDVMSAQIVGVCTLDDDRRVSEFEAWGLTPEETAAVRSQLDPCAGLLGETLNARTLGRVDASQRLQRTAIGLPPSHPDVTTLLAVPLVSASRIHGWFYAANRLGGDFPPGDEQLAVTLGSQLASEFENRLLVDRVQRHAALLEAESRERKVALERLQESEGRFRELAENIREVFFLRDASSGAMLYVSPAFEEVWQRSVVDLYANPQAWQQAVHPDDRGVAERVQIQQAATGGFSTEYRIVRPDGSVRWIRSRGFPIRNAAGTVYRIAGLAEDITATKLQELSVRRLSRIHRVLSGINSAIVRIHERDALLDEACRVAVEEGGFPIAWIGVFGGEAAPARVVAARGIDAATRAALDEYVDDGRNHDWPPARATLYSHSPVVVNDLRGALGPKTGPVSRRAVERGYGSMVGLPLLPNGELAGAMVLYAEETAFFDEHELALLEELASDVSFALQYISKEEQLAYLAYYDPVTGLANATLLRERLSQLLQRRSRDRTALILLDLARFGQLNDSLGRHVGDQLLTQVGKRLQAAMPDGGSLARIGADVFAIAVPTLREDTDAGGILQEKVLSALAKPFAIAGHELRVSARAGVAVYPNDGDDGETLLKNAEAALKQAKTDGLRYLFYSSKLNAQVAEDLALEQQLLAALERREYLVHYQPKIAAKSGELVGVEALLRWRNKKGVLVPPDRFIRVLENTELILDVGRWVLEQALADYDGWRCAGLKAPRVAVNVSPVQLRYMDFTEMVTAALERSGTDGSALELEITESVIMADIESNTARLQQICDAGVTIAIDDFGTGYSSLRYLAKLPVQTLKIDRSFVASMASDPDSMTLVTTIVGLAHSFDLGVVAEGVESEEQAQLLRLLQVDSLQGYLFGKPMPAAEIAKLLTRHEPERIVERR